MKNRIFYKKTLITSALIYFIFLIIYFSFSYSQYKNYTHNYNEKVLSIISLVKEYYPNIEDKEIFDIINKKSTNDNLKKYSISIIDSSLINENERLFKKYFIYNFLIITIPFLIYIIKFIIHENKKTKEINNITNLIKEINKKNYALDINDMNEDELSILKNEIYKTTIMLKSEAEISKKDKLELKDSLSDISHQLKTPLTSILIILDNLLEEPNMNIDLREDFLRDIKREIININFLVQSLLKLSKLDTNTVKFIKEDVKISNIINESIKNVTLIGELKNIFIKVDINKDSLINCDFKWQVEALSNIIKNSLEHSYNNGIVNIKVDSNKLYSKIEIQDCGEGISKKDIKHIFDRFYKGENSSHDSIGIGLALAKSIINKSNGAITVDSNNEGTTFVIKYFKN